MHFSTSSSRTNMSEHSLMMSSLLEKFPRAHLPPASAPRVSPIRACPHPPQCRQHANLEFSWGRTPNLPPAPDSEYTWVGDPSLPPDERGLRVLGTPLGTDEFVVAYLQTLSAQHRALFKALPTIQTSKSRGSCFSTVPAPGASMLSGHCHRPSLQPLPTRTNAASSAVWPSSCTSPRPVMTARRAHLALRHGGLGLRSAAAHAPAAYFASWADSLPAVASHERALSESWLRQLEANASDVRCFAAALQGCALLLADHGFRPRPWDALLAPTLDAPEDDEPIDLTRGWQGRASHRRQHRR